MYFVAETTNGRISVVGGTVNLPAAKKLAEKRAKQKLDWVELEDGRYRAVIMRGKLETVFTVRPKEER